MTYFSLLLPLFAVPLLGGAETLSGKVVKVVDGDTVYVLGAAEQQHKVRLAGIDAPERGQPFGMRSTDHLARIVAGRMVAVDWRKRDRYGLSARLFTTTPT